jgi:hypothetical protein
LTTDSIGSFQPQSRLASYAKVSPTMTISSDVVVNSKNKYCSQYTYDESLGRDVLTTYTFAVSAQGVVSFDGKNLGDYLHSDLYPNASYRETYYNDPEGFSAYIYVLLDGTRYDSKGFSLERYSGQANVACGYDD